jgi:hypothetical protein
MAFLWYLTTQIQTVFAQAKITKRRIYTRRICTGLHNPWKTKRITVENYVENVNKCPYSLF